MYDKKQGVITGPQSLASPKFQQAKFVESLDVNEVHTESVEIPVRREREKWIKGDFVIIFK